MAQTAGALRVDVQSNSASCGCKKWMHDGCSSGCSEPEASSSWLCWPAEGRPVGHCRRGWKGVLPWMQGQQALHSTSHASTTCSRPRFYLPTSEHRHTTVLAQFIPVPSQEPSSSTVSHPRGSHIGARRLPRNATRRGPVLSAFIQVRGNRWRCCVSMPPGALRIPTASSAPPNHPRMFTDAAPNAINPPLSAVASCPNRRLPAWARAESSMDWE